MIPKPYPFVIHRFSRLCIIFMTRYDCINYNTSNSDSTLSIITQYSSYMAAQTTMLLSTGNRVSGHEFKSEPLVQTLKPKPFSRFLFPSVLTVDCHPSSSSTATRYVIESKAPAVKKAPVVKKKSTVEDGIFGTSGGIGFTKQNELFVGRVAMIGFAASLLGEAITGKGILSQLNLETGIPIYEAEPLLLFFILFNLLGAIGALGDRGRFVDEATGIDKAVVPPGKDFRSALGLGKGGRLFGFTKANELFVGRLAQLGIAFSIIGEIITGKGALAQLNIETGVPINEIEPLLLFNIVFFFVAAINPGSGKFVTDEED